MNSTLELIAGIVSRLPESAEEARTLRQKLLAAQAAADEAGPGIVAEINATIMALIAAQSAADIAAGDSEADTGSAEADQAGGGEVDDGATAVPADQFAASEDFGDQPRPVEQEMPQQAAGPEMPSTPAPAPDSTESAGEQAAQAEPVPQAEPAVGKEPARWTEREKLLYADIIHLFQLGDHSGAMASLERVYMLAPGAGELGIFLKKNEATLLKLYRDHIGSMDRVTLPSRGRRTIRIPTPDPDLMLKIIRMSDGHRPIKDFIRKFEEPELHILMVISHLTRSGYLELA